MAEEKFDIKQWLLDVDTSRVDESLDEEAKRLFVLNDALLNPDYGPVLAALIVTAEEDCGLDALTELADCSEPRLVMMAIVNVLNILANENPVENEFVIPDATSSPGNELFLSREDFPSQSFVRSKVAYSLLQLSNFFVDRVEAGDFCPDFLTFLLTALMNISVLREGEELEDEEKIVLSVPTQRFLKTIIRTWKTSELSQHRSETENEDSFNLGFLVTCYLKSLCVHCRNSDNVVSAEAAAVGGSRQPTGLQALIDMGDWAVKFILMRLYNPSVTAVERANLITVLNRCGLCSEAFTDTMIRESALTAIWRTTEIGDSRSQVSGTMSPTETMASLRTTVPSVMLLNHFSNHLLPGIAVPGSGIWFENKQSRVTLWICRALASMVRQAMRSVLLSDFPDTEEGRAQSPAVISLASQLISQVWKAGIAVLFRVYRSPQRPLRAAFLNLFEMLDPVVEALCLRRNLQWDEVSRLNRMATLQVGIKACNALKRNLDLWQKMKSGENVRELAFIENSTDLDLCEWCLNDNDGLLMICGQCRQVAYCSVDHQRAHWAQGHKAECRFFRNCLEGSSFSYSNGGKLCGLERADEGNADLNTPFGEFGLAQRKELLVLGYRMPGVMFEMRGTDDIPEVLYRTRLNALRAISEFTNSVDLPWESTINNLLITESLMFASRETPALLHMRCSYDRNEARTFSLHCATSEYSQSLSVRLLP